MRAWGRLACVGQQGTSSIRRERALPRALALREACSQSLLCDPEMTTDAVYRLSHPESFKCCFNPAVGSETKGFSQDLRKGKLPGAQNISSKFGHTQIQSSSFSFICLFHYRKFSHNTVAQLWYFVKCVYFGLSAYQIRCGYPTRVLGNFLTKSYNYVNLFLFQG